MESNRTARIRSSRQRLPQLIAALPIFSFRLEKTAPNAPAHAYAENQPRWRKNRSHHQVAAVDMERRARDVTGGLGGGEANQIGDFERGAEARHRIAYGETFKQLVRGMFVRQLGIDHTRTDSVHGDAELAELFRRRARQSEESG